MLGRRPKQPRKLTQIQRKLISFFIQYDHNNVSNSIYIPTFMMFLFVAINSLVCHVTPQAYQAPCVKQHKTIKHLNLNELFITPCLTTLHSAEKDKLKICKLFSFNPFHIPITLTIELKAEQPRKPFLILHLFTHPYHP